MARDEADAPIPQRMPLLSRTNLALAPTIDQPCPENSISSDVGVEIASLYDALAPPWHHEKTVFFTFAISVLLHLLAVAVLPDFRKAQPQATMLTVELAPRLPREQLIAHERVPEKRPPNVPQQLALRKPEPRVEPFQRRELQPLAPPGSLPRPVQADPRQDVTLAPREEPTIVPRPNAPELIEQRPEVHPQPAQVVRAEPRPQAPVEQRIRVEPHPTPQPHPRVEPAPIAHEEATPPPRVETPLTDRPPAVPAPVLALQRHAEARPELKQEIPSAPSPAPTQPQPAPEPNQPNVTALAATPKPNKIDDEAVISRFAAEISNQLAKQISERDYPRLARNRGWEGTCQLLLGIGTDGKLHNVSVVTSSGHEILDQRAVEKVTRFRLPAVPLEIQSRTFNVRIPIKFALRDR